MKKKKPSRKKTHKRQANFSKIIYAYVAFTAVVLSGAIILQSNFHRNQLAQQHAEALAAQLTDSTLKELPSSARDSLAHNKTNLSQNNQTQNISEQSHQNTPPPKTAENTTTNAVAVDTPPKEPVNQLKQNKVAAPPITVKQIEKPKIDFDGKPYISIIIDDIGYQYRPGERIINLPGQLTLAFLPFSPYAQRLAEQAHALGKETMLHAPMEPSGKENWGEGLDRTMEQMAIQQTVVEMLEVFPHVKGVNNHMGSALTEHRHIMNWVMEEITKRDLYFVDSLTTPRSQAGLAAKAHQIPTYSRDIFLDHEPSEEKITLQFQRLIRLAKSRGYALGIGHPYPETLDVLERELATLTELGVELVPVSTLLGLVYGNADVLYALKDEDLSEIPNASPKAERPIKNNSKEKDAEVKQIFQG